MQKRKGGVDLMRSQALYQAAQAICSTVWSIVIRLYSSVGSQTQAQMVKTLDNGNVSLSRADGEHAK